MSTVTNAQKFVAALVYPLRDLEAMWAQMRAMSDLNTSVGVWLTGIGKRVGRQREGVSDDNLFRRLVRAKIVVNNSCGAIDDLILIAELVVFDEDADYVVTNYGGGTLVLRIADIALDWAIATTLIRLLARAVHGGVRIRLDFVVDEGEDDYANAFRFSSVTSPSVGVGGHGSVTDPTVGGDLAAGIE